MVRRIQSLHVVGLLTVLIGAAGCSGLDQLGGTMDMAVSHIAESNRPEYEGPLQSIQRIGALTAIQFADGGPIFDVVQAPTGLLRGDIVRIYKTEAGYVAHLWRRPEGPATFSDVPPPPSPTADGS